MGPGLRRSGSEQKARLLFSLLCAAFYQEVTGQSAPATASLFPLLCAGNLQPSLLHACGTIVTVPGCRIRA
jgi:hypothetical protein